MKKTFTHAGEAHTVELIRTADGYLVRHGDQTHDVKITQSNEGRIELQIDGKDVSLYMAVQGDDHWVAYNGRAYELRQEKQGRRRGSASAVSSEGVLRAPMPGQIRSINIGVGDEVKKGQSLLVLEAMKMEIRIQSPSDGVIASLPVSEADQVEKDQVLVEVVSDNGHTE
jgi:acetyl/propionyl-CoA carboxylase alpha subunit